MVSGLGCSTAMLMASCSAAFVAVGSLPVPPGVLRYGVDVQVQCNRAACGGHATRRGGGQTPLSGTKKRLEALKECQDRFFSGLRAAAAQAVLGGFGTKRHTVPFNSPNSGVGTSTSLPATTPERLCPSPPTRCCCVAGGSIKFDDTRTQDRPTTLSSARRRRTSSIRPRHHARCIDLNPES